MPTTPNFGSWVIILEPKIEPIVKRCRNLESEKQTMSDARKLHPEAQIICAHTNPGDPMELRVQSEADWKSVYDE